MDMNRPTAFDTSWERAAELLDATFPLADGSHEQAADYLVHGEHLLVILADGTCTGLARPGQFVDAGGNPEAPCSIVLEHEGLQVDMEPCNRAARAAGRCREHRLALLSEAVAA